MEKITSGFSENIPSKKHFLGHRARLKEKFRENGAESLADYELLELLLFRSIPRRDTKPLAKRLIDEFGSFSEVISAPSTRLITNQWPWRRHSYRLANRKSCG